MEAAVSRTFARWAALVLGAACFVSAVASAAELAAKPAGLVARLRAQVQAVDARLDGVLGVYVEDLASGSVIELRADEVFPTASSIKPAVLYELYRQAQDERLDLQEITRPTLPRVGGGGVLQELGDRVSLTWRDLAILMMRWSDNEATNQLMRRVGRDAVNRRLDALSLGKTRLRREMMDLAAARRGDENLGTPAEMAQLVEHVYRGTGLSPERARDLAAVAATPKLILGSASIPFRAPLPEGLKVLDKGGELEGVRCVTAVVDLPGRPYVAAIMTSYLRREADGEAAIREISEAAFQTFDRLARASEHGRIISER
jgi:beta-lactamase class A